MNSKVNSMLKIDNPLKKKPGELGGTIGNGTRTYNLTGLPMIDDQLPERPASMKS